MAKSDSTRKPLPNVWLLLLPDGDFLGYVSKTKAQAKEMFKPGDRMAQYAPLQKPRRCVCSKGRFIGAIQYKFCPYCGGRIVRRKS